MRCRCNRSCSIFPSTTPPRYNMECRARGPAAVAHDDEQGIRLTARQSMTGSTDDCPVHGEVRTVAGFASVIQCLLGSRSGCIWCFQPITTQKTARRMQTTTKCRGQADPWQCHAVSEESALTCSLKASTRSQQRRRSRHHMTGGRVVFFVGLKETWNGGVD